MAAWKYIRICMKTVLMHFLRYRGMTFLPVTDNYRHYRRLFGCISQKKPLTERGLNHQLLGYWSDTLPPRHGRLMNGEGQSANIMFSLDCCSGTRQHSMCWWELQIADVFTRGQKWSTGLLQKCYKMWHFLQQIQCCRFWDIFFVWVYRLTGVTKLVETWSVC